MNSLVAYVGAIISIVSLVGLLFAAGQQWGDLKARNMSLEQRVNTLESRERYEHGTYSLPTGAK